MIGVTCMRFLLIAVLLHESHEEDEDDRGGGDTNDDGDNDDSTSYICTYSDVSITHRYLSDNLIIETSNKSV
jgi:hypothetical protein